MASLDDPILARLRAALDAAYGDGLERVDLFGSRARREAGPDSDYDVAVFLIGTSADLAGKRLVSPKSRLIFPTTRAP